MSLETLYSLFANEAYNYLLQPGAKVPFAPDYTVIPISHGKRRACPAIRMLNKAIVIIILLASNALAESVDLPSDGLMVVQSCGLFNKLPDELSAILEESQRIGPPTLPNLTKYLLFPERMPPNIYPSGDVEIQNYTGGVTLVTLPYSSLEGQVCAHYIFSILGDNKKLALLAPLSSRVKREISSRKISTQLEFKMQMCGSGEISGFAFAMNCVSRKVDGEKILRYDEQYFLPPAGVISNFLSIPLGLGSEKFVVLWAGDFVDVVKLSGVD